MYPCRANLGKSKLGLAAALAKSQSDLVRGIGSDLSTGGVMSSLLVLLHLIRLEHGKLPTSVTWAALLGSGAAALTFVADKLLNPDESDDTVCTTKSGTYQIRAPGRRLTKEEQLDLCKNYVEAFEKTQSSWLRPYLHNFCGVHPHDILKNIRA